MPVRVVEELNICANIAEGWQQGARRVVNTTIHRISARWQAALDGPKHGRTYQRGRIGKRMNAGYRAAGLESYRTAKGTEMAIVGYRYHRASAPGEAPATDTGNLANSIYARMLSRAEGEIGSTAEYAARLEFGGAHVAPRPALGPAVKAEIPAFEAAMRELIG